MPIVNRYFVYILFTKFLVLKSMLKCASVFFFSILQTLGVEDQNSVIRDVCTSVFENV